jgi:4-carboxymuconolactone decarboxylase
MPELVTALTPEQLSPAMREQSEQAERAGRAGLAEFVRVMAHAEPLFEAYNTAYMASRMQNHLGARVTELVRLAIANTTSCRVCLAGRHPAAVAEGMDEALVASIPLLLEEDGADAPFTQAERAAVRFALKFGTDHLSVDDGDTAALREHFDDRQIVELALLCTMSLMGRFSAMLGLDDLSCPVPAAAGADTRSQ